MSLTATAGQGAAPAAPSPGSGFRPVPTDVARSWLLVPGTRAGGLDRVTPDVTVWDLEDGVAADRKAEARERVLGRLSERSAWVRIGDAASVSWSDDLDAIGRHPGLAGVMLAKAEGAHDIQRTADRLPVGLPIVPMIESGAALELVSEIARHPATLRLAFGVGDFRRDTGIGDDPIALAYPRSRMVVASAAAGIASPIDGPSRCASDELAAAVRHGRTMGLGGKLVLDPGQLDTVERELSPSTAEIGWAEELLAAPAPEGIDGSYAPTLARARRIVELAAAYDLLG
ncbi:MAG: aldolase/citrate lyase family protein [Naasia sp.]